MDDVDEFGNIIERETFNDQKKLENVTFCNRNISFDRRIFSRWIRVTDMRIPTRNDDDDDDNSTNSDDDSSNGGNESEDKEINAEKKDGTKKNDEEKDSDEEDSGDDEEDDLNSIQVLKIKMMIVMICHQCLISMMMKLKVPTFK